jgi:hypothetical protein
VRVTERSDRIEPLLVRHDEQYVGSRHNVILSGAKNLGSIWIDGLNQKQTRDVSQSLRWREVEGLNMTALSMR